MKSSFAWLVLVLLLLNILAGCAPGPNQSNKVLDKYNIVWYTVLKR
jgi:hypothetical protein